MRFVARSLAVFIFIALLAGFMGSFNASALPAQADAPTTTPTSTEIPGLRKKIEPYTFTWYDWWLARWENNEVICRILVEHTGQPNLAEIRNACGDLLAREWAATKPCNLAEIGACRGMYLHFVRSFPGKRNNEIILPQPQVWISLADCNPGPTINRCANLPSLLLTGEEQLPSEQIIRIQGTLGGDSFSCPGSACVLPLHPTGTEGINLEFWGDSSYGDSTEHYQALIRITAIGDFASLDSAPADEQQWNVDIISPQWRDGTLTSCSDTWQVFPETGGPPAWLNTPVNLQDMLSTQSYYYLAGQLIDTGQVTANDCPDGGLIAPKVANQCGLERAMPLVVEWQNQFDTEIMEVSKNTGIPAQLMKNVFGRESQFWPGLYKDINESGLGQLTEKGADTLLLWNPTFFQNFCPTVLSTETCSKGFVFLTTSEQDLLRGRLVGQVNAACPNCPVGVDFTQANFSIRVFAESLRANCSQTGRIVTNITSKKPGQVASFIDLWKFTLVNYNAGPGCLWSAMSASYKAGEALTWKNVSARLDPVCHLAVEYVDSISGGQKQTPTPTAWVFGGTALPPPVFPTAPLYTPTPQSTATPGGPTPTPTLTPTTALSGSPAARTPTPTRGAGATATQSSYPSGPTSTQGAAATQSGYPAQNATPTPTSQGYSPP